MWRADRSNEAETPPLVVQVKLDDSETQWVYVKPCRICGERHVHGAGGGLVGAFIITIGVFAPAFAFTMIGHDYLERLVNHRAAHAFLDGVTAGVVGLISATALSILSEILTGIHAWIIFSLALIALFISKSKWIVAAVILAAGLYGLIFL